MGLKFGLDGEWFLTSHFSILGKAAASLIYGNSKLKETIIGGLLIGPPTHILPENLHFQQAMHRMRPNIEGQLGLQWQTFFSEERYRVRMGAFYMLSYWWNQNQIINDVISLDFHSLGPDEIAANIVNFTTNKGGDLQLQGVQFQVGLDF